MSRKNEDFSKARILVFSLPNKPEQVYIFGTLQSRDSAVISSLNQKRVAYLNRLQLDENRREPRQDALADILAGFDYKMHTVLFPCKSRQELYREVERMYARMSAEQKERNRASWRKYRTKNIHRERQRFKRFYSANRTRMLARKRELYHQTKCKPYFPINAPMKPEVPFGVKKEKMEVSFD